MESFSRVGQLIFQGPKGAVLGSRAIELVCEVHSTTVLILYSLSEGGLVVAAK